MTSYQVAEGHDGLTVTVTPSNPAIITWPHAIPSEIRVAASGGPVRFGFGGGPGVGTVPSGGSRTVSTKVEANPITLHLEASGSVSVTVTGYHPPGVLLSAPVPRGSGGGGAATTPDATTTAKGVARLLGGTADAPTVPAGSVTGLAEVATAGTYASLAGKPSIPAEYSDLTGTVPQGALPAIALTEFLGSVGSQSAMLALTGQRGDWCKRADLGTDWQLVAEPSTSPASWQEHTYPSSPVSSVNGRTGTVSGLAENSAVSALTSRVDLVAAPTITLADGPTIAVNAAAGSRHRVTLGGNHTLGSPTGAYAGQVLVITVAQDATGGRVPTLGSKYRLPAGTTSLAWSTAAGRKDRLALLYDDLDDRFDVVGFTAGFGA